MRILIDARFYGLENAGLGRYTINLVGELQKQDTKNHYLILLRKKYFEELKLTQNFEKILADIPHYSLKEQLEIPKIIKKYKPDLVHFLHFNAPLSFNGKFVVTIHDMTMHFQTTNSTNLFLPIYYAKHFAYKKIFAHAILKSQKILVPSQFVKNEIMKNFKIPMNKIAVTYEGITNLNSYPAKTSDWLTRSDEALEGTSIRDMNFKGKYFLYVGNAYPHKNLEFAIKAIVELNKSISVNFYIVSSRNIFTKRLEALLSKLNAQKFVKLMGFVPDEKLKTLRENSVGFIYPSLTEGFGLPGLEAMQSGTLLIASDIPVFKEIYTNHAIYFNPYDITSLVSALEKALALPIPERQKNISANKKFVSRYSWSKMTKQTLEVYNSFR